MSDDLTYRSAAAANLLQAAAKVAERALEDTSDAVRAIVCPSILAGTVTLVVSVRMTPPQIAVHAVQAIPLMGDPDPYLLAEIEWPEGDSEPAIG